MHQSADSGWPLAPLHRHGRRVDLPPNPTNGDQLGTHDEPIVQPRNRRLYRRSKKRRSGPSWASSRAPQYWVTRLVVPPEAPREFPGCGELLVKDADGQRRGVCGSMRSGPSALLPQIDRPRQGRDRGQCAQLGPLVPRDGLVPPEAQPPPSGGTFASLGPELRAVMTDRHLEGPRRRPGPRLGDLRDAGANTPEVRGPRSACAATSRAPRRLGEATSPPIPRAPGEGCRRAVRSCPSPATKGSEALDLAS